MTHVPSAAPPVIEGVEWIRPGPTPTQRRNDLWLALALFVGTVASTALYRVTGLADEQPFWVAFVWAAGMSVPLIWRRVQPEIVALVLSTVLIVGAVMGTAELLLSNIDLFIAVYSVGAWGRSRRLALIARTIIVVAMFGWLYWGLVISANVPDMLSELPLEGGPISPYVAFALINVLTNLLYFGGAWYFGDSAYRSARARAALEERTAELESERERSRAQAVELERLRIARELHDVVAHHVSVIGVQAGAARRVLARDPEQAATALTAIEGSAREAIAELHGLLGTLRHEDGADGPKAPDGTSLADLPALVAESASAGVPTSYTVIGDPKETSGLVAVTAYRLVQEALTNVRKHAGATATADVRLRWTDDALEVEVADTGVGGSAAGDPAGSRVAPAGHAGLGHAGMRERVAAAGGALEFGPRHRGGYLVRASLPLRRAEVAR